MRRVLPSRRPCITVNAEYNGMPLVVTIGVDPATRATMKHKLQIGESTLDSCLKMLRLGGRIEVNHGPYRFKLYSVRDVF